MLVVAVIIKDAEINIHSSHRGRLQAVNINYFTASGFKNIFTLDQSINALRSDMLRGISHGCVLSA